MANRASSPVERDDDALFVENGVPVKFCFHTSITQGRSAITRDIQRHGGQIVSSERDTNVLLIDEQQDLAFFRKRYYHSTELYRLELYVEPRGFVQRCIRAGMYTHDRPVKQGMPGMAPGGRARVAFTEADRDHLAYFLATKLPTRDGRMGQKAYQELQQLGKGDDPSWAWAKRHTWHSWREHYKKNRVMMDGRIDFYVERLKNVGHHLGHDPRRHRQEEEEDTDSEVERQRQRMVGQDRQRREQGRPAAAAGRRRVQAARDHLARHEPDLVPFDSEGEGGEDEEPDAHHQPHPRNVQGKRARVSEAPSDEDQESGAEAGRAERTPLREEDNNSEASQEISGSDLFGDYKDRLRFDFDDDEGPQPFPPSASPVPERDGVPPSTQATLIAQSPLAEKERPFASSPTRAIEPPAFQVTALEQTFPPSSQQTVVVAQQRVVQRSRVGGTSAQREPPMPRKTRTRGGTAAPYRNTRARSRSVDPEPLPQPGRQSPEGKGKGKAREVLAPIEDMLHEEEGEEESAEEEIGPVSNTDDGLSRRETLGEEEAVEDLLEASDNVDMQQDVNMEEPPSAEVDEEQGGSQEEDGLNDDAEIGPQIESRHQDVDMGQPSDSDDAETHGSLIRGTAGDPSEEEQDGDDMNRVERMERNPPTPPQPRITRSMAATAWPRRAQSEHQVRVAPGPKARAVVDRVQEVGRSMPYERRAVRGKSRQIPY